jgi:plastocyanin
MSRKTLLTALAALGLFAVLAGAACGGDSAGARPPGVPDDAPFIDQDNLKFKPSSLTISAGETVYFANSESALHTVTINGENESGPMRRGDIFQFTFEEPGTYRITCDYHPQMRATVTVE